MQTELVENWVNKRSIYLIFYRDTKDSKLVLNYITYGMLKQIVLWFSLIKILVLVFHRFTTRETQGKKKNRKMVADEKKNKKERKYT